MMSILGFIIDIGKVPELYIGHWTAKIGPKIRYKMVDMGLLSVMTIILEESLLGLYVGNKAVKLGLIPFTRQSQWTLHQLGWSC